MKPFSPLPSDSDPWTFSTGRRGYERETFEGPTQLLPELDIFGWLRFHTALTGALRPDQHPGAFEILYMVRGHLRWWVEQEHHQFNTGQVFIIRPGEMHGDEESAIQPCEHYWLRIKFPTKQALPSLTLRETAELREAFEHLSYRAFTASREVGEFFDRLLEEHRHGQTPHAVLMSRATLHALLITILRDHHRHTQLAKQKPLVTWRVRNALQWLEQQLYQSDLRLETAAKNVGLTPAGLRARFKAETGYTLHEYLIQRRISEARRFLAETDDDITTIAHALAFSSSQYFASVFRRQTGMSPGEFRQRHRRFSNGNGG